MRTWQGWVLAVVIGMAAGCDDKPQAPRAPANNATQPAVKSEDSRPKAAAYASALRTPLQISDFPLTMEVPPGWKVESLGAGTVTVLQGPIPSGPLPDGVIHVMLSRLPTFTGDAVARIEASAKKEADAQPGETRLFESRKLGNAKVIEQQVVSPAEPGKHMPAMLNWTISVYVSSDKDQFTPYVLRFIDLRLDAYEQDKQLLQQMVASLKVDLAPGLNIGK